MNNYDQLPITNLSGTLLKKMLDIIICLALTLAEQHAYLFLCIFCITVLVGSLLYAYVSKVDRLIIGSLAAWHLWALPGVEDG